MLPHVLACLFTPHHPVESDPVTSVLLYRVETLNRIVMWPIDSKIYCKVRVKLAVCEGVYGSEEGAPRVRNFGTKCVEWLASRLDRLTPIQY